MRIANYGAGVFTISEFLTASESCEFIELGERIGYEQAEIQTAIGSRRIADIRNNDRVIFDDEKLADALFLKAKPYLPDVVQAAELVGFNERFRFYRYENEQYFKWHKDGSFCRPDGSEMSLLTFLIYLNGDFEGGHTQFQWESIAPEAGMALIFPHNLMHQGAPVISGRKYVLRTDIMYKNHS